MICAALLCDLSFLAGRIAQQVSPCSLCSPSFCQIRRQQANDMQPVLQSADEQQALTWCEQSVSAAQLGILTFAQFRKVPEAKFLDPRPDGAPAMSMHPGSLLSDIAGKH